MRATNCTISSCRHCLFYESQGRRGGQCQQLGVPVQGSWKACSLAVPPFVPAWEKFDPVVLLSQNTVEIRAVDPLALYPTAISDPDLRSPHKIIQ